MVILALVVLVVLGTSIWVAFDSGSLRAEGVDIGRPFWWLVGCLLFWVIVFPFYLVDRRDSVREHRATPGR